MWREMISAISSTAEFHPPVSRDELRSIEAQLRQSVPVELEQLLLETNGISDEYGTEIVWSAERILRDNTSFRSDGSYRNLYMSFGELMFFGDNGGGDQFAFVRSPEREDVFVWDHETDSRNWVSPNLESYVESALRSAGQDWYRGQSQ